MRETLLILTLAIGAYYDLKERIVPNKIIFSAIGVAFLLNVIEKRYSYIIVSIAVFLVLYIIYSIKDVIGGGDIKGITFIVLVKGIDFLGITAYYILMFSIPLIIYYLIKQKIKETKETLPLYVPMFLATVYVTLGGI